MASKRRLRRKSCAGKQAHATLGAALAHRKALIRSGLAQRGSLDVYTCHFAAHYHVGHNGRP